MYNFVALSPFAEDARSRWGYFDDDARMPSIPLFVIYRNVPRHNALTINFLIIVFV